MSDQYLRKIELLVTTYGASTVETSNSFEGDAGSATFTARKPTALDLSEFRIRFHVSQACLQSPSSAVIRVYNLATNTSQAIRSAFSAALLNNGYTRVTLKAGYQDGAFGMIFDGTLYQPRIGRESGTDTFLELVAASGNVGLNQAILWTNFVAGWTPTDLHDAIHKSLVAADPTISPTSGFHDYTDTKMPRGKVMSAPTTDYMRDLAASQGGQFQLINGTLSFVPYKQTLPNDGPEFILTQKTGMIGLPVQTENGIDVRCLLNPNIKTGGRVRIANTSIQEAQLSTDFTALNYFPEIAKEVDGEYKILSTEFEGDTRGNEWYADLICVTLNSPSPLGLVPKGL